MSCLKPDCRRQFANIVKSNYHTIFQDPTVTCHSSDAVSSFRFHLISVFSFLRSRHINNTLHERKRDSAKCCRPSLHRESISFMKGVMDECTHMANFSGKFYGVDWQINRQCFWLVPTMVNIIIQLQVVDQKTWWQQGTTSSYSLITQLDRADCLNRGNG